MRIVGTTCLVLLGWGLGIPCMAQPFYPGFIRGLPDAYVPGKTMTVSLDFDIVDFASFYGLVVETIPSGWSFDWANTPPKGFNQETGEIFWEFAFWCTFGIRIRYDVTPPDGAMGDVSFDGCCLHRAPPERVAPLVMVQTKGDTALKGRIGVMRRVPEEYPSLQAAVDASSFGDTVIVSNAGVPYYLQDLHMKQGVDFKGSGSPMLLAPSSAPTWTPILWSAPNTRVEGLRFSSTGTGISIGSHDVQIANCVFTGMTSAIDFYQFVDSRITNCTFVRNGTGVNAFESAADLVTNCIFYENTQDVTGAHVTFSCLHDEITDGSGENNIYANPLFVDELAGDYRLRVGSPSIDAGDNGAVSPGDKDIAGNPRILNGGKGLRVDMGAYEHRLPPPVFDAAAGELGLRWSSTLGKTYSIFFSDDLTEWHHAEDVPAMGNLTYWLDPMGWPPTVGLRFYRVMEKE